ncbi:MAG TPA: thiamine pyrophosphate-binding protein, partial [Clostridia bacterium]|nr:thiamine pyrophosphate-binding protein [Clostridia bacterium]
MQYLKFFIITGELRGGSKNMYTDIKHIQILIALLKKYGVTHCVISPGTRHIPLVHSVEDDPDFTCYSIVDERSAAFFALGLIQELHKPVAICCTSSTASCNYHSAITEAFYRDLPLVILTADRNLHFLNQREEQQIPQENLYRDVVKKSVTLPFVKDQDDYEYCIRIVNDALLEMDHHGKGPVHINYPVYSEMCEFHTEKLPDVRKIDRLVHRDADKAAWDKKLEELKKANAIMVNYGVSNPLDKNSRKAVEKFAEQFNCVIMTDQESNYKGKKSVNSFAMWRSASGKISDELFPDIIITVHGNTSSEIK